MNIAVQMDNKPLKKILLQSFLGGAAWGLGLTVGATVVLTIGAFILAKIDYVPIVGNFVILVTEFISENNPNL